MAIKPLSLPQSSGINLGNNDIRHFSVGDAVDVPSLQNPTRHLAQRDNALAEKVNEVIETVNNQEQFVPLPVIRTILPPADETIVANYRIPAGFESRVLNAVIAASPVSTDIELNIYYNTGYGNVTGTSVISTSSEYSGGVSFYQEGEFIVSLKNKSGITLELAASILLTLRPVGAEGGLLVASVVKGERGDPGPTGPRGAQGPPGTGGAGSPGMNWTGTWAYTKTYAEKDVVSYGLYGTLISSFICKQSHAPYHLPQLSYNGSESYWEAVVIAAPGVAGPVGPTGSAVYIKSTVVYGTLVTNSNYVGSSSDPEYSSVGALSTTYKGLKEYQVQTSAGSLCVIQGQWPLNFTGDGTITLPKLTYGAAKDYSNTDVNVIVTTNGTGVVDASTKVPLVRCFPNLSDKWRFTCNASVPIQSVFSFNGAYYKP